MRTGLIYQGDGYLTDDFLLEVECGADDRYGIVV